MHKGLFTIKSKYGILEFTAPVCESNKYQVKYLFCNGVQLFVRNKEGISPILVTYNNFCDIIKSYHKKRMNEVRIKGIRYV